MTRADRVEVARHQYVVIRAVLLVVIVAVALATIGAFAYLWVSQSAESKCLEKWAANFSDSYAIRVGASGERQDALDALVRSIATNDKTKETDAYEAYVTASNQYKVIAAAHPFPPSPQIVCK